MSDIISSWVKESEENEREFHRQMLITDVAEAIHLKMEERNINKSALAKLLDKTSSYVTQVLTGSRNMTLTTLSDLAFALDARVKVSVIDCDAESDWSYDDVSLPAIFLQAQELYEMDSTGPCNDEIYAYSTTIVPFRRREAA